MVGKREDPDDAYIDVQRREEERKKQGLPPGIGVVPYSGEERMEMEKEPKKAHRRKRPKPAANAKSLPVKRAMTEKRQASGTHFPQQKELCKYLKLKVRSSRTCKPNSLGGFANKQLT